MVTIRVESSSDIAACEALLNKAFPLWKQTHAEVDRLIVGRPGDLRGALRALV